VGASKYRGTPDFRTMAVSKVIESGLLIGDMARCLVFWVRTQFTT
jgi:hypothetical protein